MRRSEVSHQFVEVIPEEPGEGVVYVSTTAATAVHRCLCGCGSTVSTPLDPSQWKLEFDGRTISLDPAIDNWKLDCRSNYKIKRNCVRWLLSWSQVDVEVGRGPLADALNHWAKTRAQQANAAKDSERLEVEQSTII